MCEILPHISFENLANAPAKWFMGYSDNTNLVFTLTTICDAAAIYGPCGPTFGMEPWHSAIKDALDQLQVGQVVVGGDEEGHLQQQRQRALQRVPGLIIILPIVGLQNHILFIPPESRLDALYPRGQSCFLFSGFFLNNICPSV